MGGKGVNERLEKNFVVKRRKGRKNRRNTFFCLKTNSKRDQGHSNKRRRGKRERA